MEEYDYDDTELGYYDSEEEVDDSLYFKEEESEPIANTPVIVNKFVQKMNVPMELIIEILKYTDLDTFVKLCQSSKDIKNVCTNPLWELKFKQIDHHFYQNVPNTYQGWLKLYYSLPFYDQADQYIDMFLRVKHRVFTGEDYNFKIRLVKDMSSDAFRMILGKIGINISPYATFSINRDNGIKVIINNVNKLTYIFNVVVTDMQLREFIYQLFVNRYLNKLWRFSNIM